MKITSALLLIACLHVGAAGISQKITLNERNANLEKVFRSIHWQSGFQFIYNDETMEKARPVTIQVKDATLDEVLALCFKGQPLEYTMQNNAVVVKPKQPALPVTTPEAPLPLDVRGRVVNENGDPVAGATVKVKGTDKGTSTNENGEFVLTGIGADATLVISGVNIETFETKVGGRTSFMLTAKIKVTESEAVVVNTGYQQVPKEQSTGSVVVIDNALINRRVSTNILDRLDGVTSGLAFNRNFQIANVNATTSFQPNQSAITIRGRSTINANPNSLIVVDNFPYEGDLSTINPNDVESITVLKDAAAASIWGAFSGNGVIVITTKKGRYNQPVKVMLNSNVTIANKPDLYYVPGISTSDYIDVERYLYGKGFYTSTLANGYTTVSPVVSILAAQTAGTMTPSAATAAIDALRELDSRDQVGEYLYRKEINQQYVLNLSGGGYNNRYFISAGLDKNQYNLINNDYQRTSIRGSNTVSLLKQKLEITTDIAFTQSVNSTRNGIEAVGPWPYLQIADADGNALVVPYSGGYRKSYTDTTGKGLLLDWTYRPLDEAKLGNRKRRITDYHIGLNMKYRIIAGLDVQLMYQYNKGTTENKDYYSQQTFFTRSMINSFSRVNFTSGTITRPIPLGGILDRYVNNYKSNNVRVQANYAHTWNGVHELTALAGADVRDYDGDIYSNRLYGYDPSTGSAALVDYTGQFQQYATVNTMSIFSNLSNFGVANNYISYFANAGYTYSRRYTVIASARRDESNLFGVKTNQKGVPLWSAGASWVVSNEKFYKAGWLPYLKLRFSNGYQGNINKDVAAVTTATYPGTNNSYGAIQAYINNLPNAALRWEKVNQVNAGIDFGSKNNRIGGSIDYFIKKGTDLIAASPLDPTTGATTFTGNTADIKGRGVDLVLNTKNITGVFKWNTTFLFSYAKDKVTAYKVATGAVSSYIGNTGVLSPIIGRPLYSVYSVGWAGLDANGNPQVIRDGKVSTEYSALFNSTDLKNLVYNGPMNPPVFGSLRNTLEWKQLSLSFLITYKFGHYFRRNSLNYGSLFNNTAGRDNPDYENRWQKPGDEAFTNVPSMIYPANSARDAAYLGSEILVEKGDHIRLQDIQLNYTLTPRQVRKLPFQSVNFYVYMNNIGILWRANDHHIDPDYVPMSGYPLYPNPRSIAFGIRLEY
ncbi:MAG: SusC/RagA family TonB-linked outer membrane protein [Chitinophagaceae bacterium]